MRTLNKLAQGALAATLGLAFSVSALAADITGAGATFPYAVYTKWAEAYRSATGNKINYQGIGSSGGVKQIKAKTVDFGGTDAPVSESDLDAAGLVQVPTVMGGFSPYCRKQQIKPLPMTFAVGSGRGVATRHNQPLPGAVTEGNHQQHTRGPRWSEVVASCQPNKCGPQLAWPIDMLVSW